MIKYSWLVLGLLALPGCPGGKCDSGGDCDSDSAGEGEGEGEGEVTPSFSASWSASGVTISIEDGSGSYEIGMAETDPASPDPWTGEDCLNGYTTGSGTTYLYCHPASSTGVALSTVTSLDDIVEGETTIFSSSLSSVITYAATSDSTGECWTWGHDTSYYTGAGCTAAE